MSSLDSARSRVSPIQGSLLWRSITLISVLLKRARIRDGLSLRWLLSSPAIYFYGNRLTNNLHNNDEPISILIVITQMGAYSPLKHGGDKPIDIDLSSFHKKSISQAVSETELSHQMELLQGKESEIKRYKYWEDFDRISGDHREQLPATQDQIIENILKICLFATLIGTRFYTTKIYRSQAILSHYRRYFLPILTSTFVLSLLFSYAAQGNHPINSYFYRETAPEEKGYRALDEEMNLYKYVDDIKYRFDYGKADILGTRRRWHQGYLGHMEGELIKRHQGTQEKLQI